MDRNQQDSTDEPHESLPEVLIVPQEFLTESSVTRESPTSSDQETRTLVISDPLAFSVDTNYVILQDEPNPEIIFGALQTENDDSLSDTLLYQHEIPQRPINIFPVITLVLHHSNSFSEMIEAFSDPEILNKTLKVRRLLPDNSVEKGIWCSQRCIL